MRWLVVTLAVTALGAIAVAAPRQRAIHFVVGCQPVKSAPWLAAMRTRLARELRREVTESLSMSVDCTEDEGPMIRIGCQESRVTSDPPACHALAEEAPTTLVVDLRCSHAFDQLIAALRTRRR